MNLAEAAAFRELKSRVDTLERQVADLTTLFGSVAHQLDNELPQVCQPKDSTLRLKKSG